MRGKTAVSIALAGIVGAIVGAFAQGDFVILSAGVVSLTGLGIAFMLNWVFIAPEAGRRAKENLINSFADPTEDDKVLIQSAGIHIIGTAGLMAKDEKLQPLLEPLTDFAAQRFLDRMDARWQAIRANVASQRERGAGNFSPSTLQQEDIIQELQGRLISEFGDPLLDALGFEGESRKVAQAVFLSKLTPSRGGDGGRGSTDTPNWITGGR